MLQKWIKKSQVWLVYEAIVEINIELIGKAKKGRFYPF
jgi:hypothetical protein